MSSVEIPQRSDVVIDLRDKAKGQTAPVVKSRTGFLSSARAVSRALTSVTALIAGLSAVSALALWFLFHAFVLTPLQEHGSQARLYAQFREQLANGVAPLGGRIKPGSPIELIDTGLRGMRDLVAVEGTTSEQLTVGPGHLRDTALPGQMGESVIFGRSVTYGGPFRDLGRLKPGDAIKVTTGQGTFTYRVDRIRRPGDPPSPAFPENESRLTLVTSASAGWRSGWAPTHAIYLEASLLGKALPAPTGRLQTVGKSSQPMRGDKALLFPILWLVGAALVTTGLIWSWRRWGAPQTWLVGVPLAMAVFWGASGAAVRFLPNLI